MKSTCRRLPTRRSASDPAPARRRGWTLREMSERTDIPVSTLSKVEHDRLTLSYDKLVQLSQKLDIRIADLFTEAAPADRSRR